jgi:hypothetical protein
VQELSNAPILPLLGLLNVLFCLFSAWEAYRTSRSQNFAYLIPPEQRPRFVQSFCGSYLGHVLALVLVVLVPVIASGGAGARGKASQGLRGESGRPDGGVSFQFDLVTDPGKIDGFGNRPEGSDRGRAKANQPEVTARNSGREGPGARRSRAAEQARGAVRSYNEYLSYRFHSSPLSELYFEQLPPGEYTVLQYRVYADGSVADIEVLRDHSTTSEEVSELAVETVRSFNPAVPLPGGVRSIKVIELFWSGSVVGEPGSLEYELSQKPDGRKVLVEP